MGVRGNWYYWVMSNPNTFRVFWTNHGYFSSEEFATIEAAMSYGKSKCFEFTVHFGDTVECSWGPISGFRTFTALATKAVSSARSRA